MGSWLEEAVEAIQKFGFVFKQPILDREDLNIALWCKFPDPSEQMAIVMAAKEGYKVDDLGYCKSLDSGCVEVAAKYNIPLILWVGDGNYLWELDPNRIKKHAKERKNNLKVRDNLANFKCTSFQFPPWERSPFVKKVLSSLCPICGEELARHDREKSCVELSQNDRFENHGRRLKYRYVVIRSVFVRNLNGAKIRRQSEPEQFFSKIWETQNFPLDFVGNDPSMEKIWGYVPDWVTNRERDVGIEYHLGKEENERRRQIAREHECKLFIIEDDWKLYRDSERKRLKLIADIAKFIKANLPPWYEDGQTMLDFEQND